MSAADRSRPDEIKDSHRSATAADPDQTEYGGDPIGGATTGYIAPLSSVGTDSPILPILAGPRQERLPRPFGNYELLERIAQGGMGVVYKARDSRLNHIVALKMIRPGSSPDGSVELFLREARAALSLQHEHILPLHEFNEVDGQPYFTMPWMQQGSLQKLLANGPLPPQVAARLVQQVAGAVQHAHERDILHRDLKPANILLQMDRLQFDDDGSNSPQTAISNLQSAIPKLADFGLARMKDSNASRTGEPMGTPSYMPPEQARGDRQKIGPASDVYGLGAVLYGLLTGRPPFQAADIYETLKQVCDREPVSPRQLNPHVPAALETVCLKCLAKDPAWRYGSAAALADDLGRFLRGEPVQAKPAGRLERGWLWCKRKPMVASLLAGLVGTMVAGTTVAWILAVQAAADAQSARDSEQTAINEKGRANVEAAAATYQKGEAEKATARAENEVERTYASLITAQFMRVAAEYERQPNKALELLHDYRNIPINRRDLIWGIYERLSRSEAPPVLDHRGAAIKQLAFNPDGKTVTTLSVSGLTSWDLTAMTEKPLPQIDITPARVTISPTGKAAADLDSGRLWDTATGRSHLTFQGHRGRAFAFSPDEKTVAFGGTGSVTLMNLESREQRKLPVDGNIDISLFAFSPDAKTFITGEVEDGQRLIMWDVASCSKKVTLKPYPGNLGSLAFSPDGKLVAAGGNMSGAGRTGLGSIRLWEARTGVELAPLEAGNGRVKSMAFSADSRILASTTGDKSVKLWDTVTFQERMTLAQHSGNVSCLAFSPDGKRLAVGCQDGTVHLWDAPAGHPTVILTGRLRIGGNSHVTFSPAANILATVEATSIHLWDPATGNFRGTLHHGLTPRERVRFVGISPDGNTAASVVDDDKVKIWDLGTTTEMAPRGVPILAESIAFTNDGKNLLFTPPNAKVSYLDLSTGEIRPAFNTIARKLTLSPDGKTLALMDSRRHVSVWDVASRQERAVFSGQDVISPPVAFSPDGRTLAGRSRDAGITLWDLATGKVRASVPGPLANLTEIAFAPDSQTLLTYGRDHAVKLWDVDTGGARGTLKVRAKHLAFSADGKLLAIAEQAGWVTLWDVRAGLPVGTPPPKTPP